MKTFSSHCTSLMVSYCNSNQGRATVSCSSNDHKTHHVRNMPTSMRGISHRDFHLFERVWRTEDLLFNTSDWLSRSYLGAKPLFIMGTDVQGGVFCNIIIRSDHTRVVCIDRFSSGDWTEDVTQIPQYMMNGLETVDYATHTPVLNVITWITDEQHDPYTNTTHQKRDIFVHAASWPLSALTIPRQIAPDDTTRLWCKSVAVMESYANTDGALQSLMPFNVQFAPTPPPVSSPPTLCQQCHNSKGIGRCARCRVAKYCSITCQELHWPIHRQSCNKENRQPITPPDAINIHNNDTSTSTNTSSNSSSSDSSSSSSSDSTSSSDSSSDSAVAGAVAGAGAASDSVAEAGAENSSSDNGQVVSNQHLKK